MKSICSQTHRVIASISSTTHDLNHRAHRSTPPGFTFRPSNGQRAYCKHVEALRSKVYCTSVAAAEGQHQHQPLHEHSTPPVVDGSNPPPPAASADHVASRGNYPRSIYIWPKLRNIRERPPFLDQYPVPSGQAHNINSFLGPLEMHSGKYYVDQDDYPRFMSEYCEAYQEGYLLFLTECYRNSPFRYFIELDFDWETREELVLLAINPVIRIILSSIQSFFQLQDPPAYVMSMRTHYKVHLNFTRVITTELLAHQCRDLIIQQCKKELGEAVFDWEKVIDFPHGSFRMLGSRKPRRLDHDPAWVRDKAYYPTRLVEGHWKPGRITETVLKRASIFPTPQQLAAFETSPAYVAMIYQDQSAYIAKLEERHRRREQGRQLAAQQPGAQDVSRKEVRAKLEVREDGHVALLLATRSTGKRWNRPVSLHGEPTDAQTDPAACGSDEVESSKPSKQVMDQ